MRSVVIKPCRDPFTAVKAVALVAGAWGVVYPALLWSLELVL